MIKLDQLYKIYVMDYIFKHITIIAWSNKLTTAAAVAITTTKKWLQITNNNSHSKFYKNRDTQEYYITILEYNTKIQ